MKRLSVSRGWLVGGVLAALVLGAVACAGGDADDRASGPSSNTDALTRDESSNNYSVAGNDVAGGSIAPGAPTDGDGVKAGEQAPQGSAGGSLGALPGVRVIQVATVRLESDAVSEDFENVGNIAAAAGGFVTSSSFGAAGDKQNASVTIRVPNDQYQAVISRIRGLADVAEIQQNGNDVTAEYTDLQSRVRNLTATEERYIQLLAQATNINEILTVQDRINFTRAEIEQAQGRIDLLSNQTSLATITVHLSPPIAGNTPKDDGGTSNPLEVAQEAWDASLATLLGIATVLVAVGAFGWWLLLLGGLVWFVARRAGWPGIPRRQA